MNHIQKSFLASATRKIIPFQMMKTNYGFSSADGDDIARARESIESSNLGFVIENLPVEASLVAIALRIPEASAPIQDLQVAAIASAPPGESTLRLPLVPGYQYYIYVLSNIYNDGYIIAGNALEEDATVKQRLVFSLSGPTDQITIDNLQLVKAPGTSETDWYPYDGKYENSKLLWADPTPLFTVSEGVGSNGTYSYLTYQRTMLDQLQQDFGEAFDVPGKYVRETLNSSYPISRHTGTFGTGTYSIQNFFLNQAIRTLKTRTYVTLTIEKWQDDPRILGSENSTGVITALKGFAYDENLHSVIGEFPQNQNPQDPAPEFNMKDSPHNALAGLAVIFRYVINAYNTSPFSSSRDFANTFKNNITFRREPELAQAVTTAIESADISSESINPILFEEGVEVFGRLKQIVLESEQTDENKGSSILELVHTYVDHYRNILQNNYPGLWTDPFDTNIENPVNEFESNIKNTAREYFAKTWKFIDDRLLETDSTIAQLGDASLLSIPEGDKASPPLAHEATLQNIRFLRRLMEESRNDIWAQSTTLNSFIVNSMVQLRNDVLLNLSRSNTVVNLTSTEQVQTNDLDVMYRTTALDGKWKKFDGTILDYSNGLKAIDVSHLKDPDHYIFVIKPKGFDITVETIAGQSVIETPSLDDYQSKNYFYGWNIEFAQAGDNGLPLGEQRMIVGSYFIVNRTQLIISPNIADRPDFTENTDARIWPNTFIPVMIDLELTEFDIETLAYANYAKKEFNKKTGVLTLYDFRGNVYKQWTIGERTKASEGFSNIDFREPIE